MSPSTSSSVLSASEEEGKAWAKELPTLSPVEEMFYSKSCLWAKIRVERQLFISERSTEAEGG